MATSTLFDNIVVNKPRALEEYVEFRERMAKEPIKPSPGSGVCRDPEKIRHFMDMALKNLKKKDEER